MNKLIADVKPGDVLILKGGYRMLVRRIEWMTHSKNVLVNGGVIFDKYDRVEVAQ